MSSNSLTTAIITYIQLRGGSARRINNIGVPIRKGNVITGMRKSPNRGTEDIICCINGKYIGIEVKIGRDVQSQEQIDRQNEILRAKGLYVIAHDFDQIKAVLDFYL